MSSRPASPRGRRIRSLRTPATPGAVQSLQRALAPRERSLRRIARAFATDHGLVVRAGPFAGLTYVAEAVGSVRNIVPRLLGSYECELHAAVERLLDFPHEAIVDIGAADGYYAVGLALRSPDRTVYAFEASRGRRRLLARVAAANGVGERVRIAGACDVSALSALDAAAAIVKVDCEGGELELLRPDAVPLLRRSALLVELHDHLRPGATESVLERFSATHSAELVPARERDPRAHPELAGLTDRDARAAVTESRPPMHWAVLVPKRL